MEIFCSDTERENLLAENLLQCKTAPSFFLVTGGDEENRTCMTNNLLRVLRCRTKEPIVWMSDVQTEHPPPLQDDIVTLKTSKQRGRFLKSVVKKRLTIAEKKAPFSRIIVLHELSPISNYMHWIQALVVQHRMFSTILVISAAIDRVTVSIRSNVDVVCCSISNACHASWCHSRFAPFFSFSREEFCAIGASLGKDSFAIFQNEGPSFVDFPLFHYGPRLFRERTKDWRHFRLVVWHSPLWKRLSRDMVYYLSQFFYQLNF